MNKLAIALSAALSLGAAASASAADGVINFEGKIEALTCSIGVGSSISDTLVLPTVSTATTPTAPAAAMRSARFERGTRS